MRTGTDFGWLAATIVAASGIPLACGGAADGGSGSTDGDGDGAGGAHGTRSVVCTPLVDLGGGYESCEEGFSHRTTTAACPPPDAVTPCDGSGGLDTSVCATDADCTLEPSGTCVVVSDPEMGATACGCRYTCETDAECVPGSICVCGAGVDGRLGFCQRATCEADADCPGSLCASAAPSGCGSAEYRCVTREDECHGNAECPTGELCTLDSQSGIRKCALSGCGAIGRPFLVSGGERVAPLIPRSDWAVDGPTPRLDGLDPGLRRRIADAWSQVGAMEHASVAAFSRFALELLSLGAPAQLIEQTHAAMADEIRHARVAFHLALAYGALAVGPGPLDVTGALGDVDRVAVVRAAIQEGCIGETLAAARAAEASRSASDPSVRDILGGIATDEARHAALAWRFVTWAIETASPAEREGIANELDCVVESCAETDGRSALPDALTGHGFVVGEEGTRLDRDVFSQIVVPSARGLARRARGPRKPHEASSALGLSA